LPASSCAASLGMSTGEVRRRSLSREIDEEDQESLALLSDSQEGSEADFDAEHGDSDYGKDTTIIAPLGTTHVHTRALLLEVLPALTAAGIGLVLAGTVLDVVQHWEVYQDVSELFILVPVLLGLKGNVDMPLASRLSTAAHQGLLRDFGAARPFFVANLALVELQTVVVGALAALVAIILGVVLHHEFDLYHCALLLASAIVTAGVTGLVFGLFTCVLVYSSVKLEFDPDNIASPLVASLGDLFTLFMLSVSADAGQYLESIGEFWVAPTIALFFIAPLPIWIRLTRSHPKTAPVLTSGWTPIVSAMAIGNVSGMFLERSVSLYQSLAVLVPFLNGVGGNLGAIFASRLSSALHSNRREDAFRSAMALLLLNLPIQLAFLGLVWRFDMGHLVLTPIFVAAYLAASSFQVIVVLVFVRWLVHALWDRKIDPDNYASPLLAAFADVLGTIALVIVFTAIFGEEGDMPASPTAVADAAANATASVAGIAKSIAVKSLASL